MSRNPAETALKSKIEMKFSSKIFKALALTGSGRVAVQLIERLAGHLEQRVQRRRIVVVLAGRLLLPGRGRGRRRRVRLCAARYFRTGTALASVRAGPAARARGRLVVGRLWPVLVVMLVLLVMVMVVLLLLVL